MLKAAEAALAAAGEKLQNFRRKSVIRLQTCCKDITEYLSRHYGVPVTTLQAVCNPTKSDAP